MQRIVGFFCGSVTLAPVVGRNELYPVEQFEISFKIGYLAKE
jgi:hypothetical protein